MIGEIEEALSALNHAHARYLVVGGVAVVLHGFLRTTADLDLLLQLDRRKISQRWSRLQMTRTEGRQGPIPEMLPTDDRNGAGDFDWGFAGHAHRQTRRGLQLSPAERLRWFEQTMDELRRLLGRARRGIPLGSETQR